MENTKLKSFKDLIVWQKAVDLAALVYSITEKFSKSELYGITNQMRRSVVSISSNIAEGFKRSHKKEKLQFYNIAYGSTAELESQIEVSYKLNFLDNQHYQKLNTAVVEIGKMIDGLIKSQSKPPKSYILSSIFFLVLLSSIFYLLNPYTILAAQINFVSQTQEIGVGQQFQVDLMLDTENENINAIEGKIVFPSNLLAVKEIRDGNSIINFWIEQPRLKEADAIVFSGITPGGFYGKKEFLFLIIFQTQAEGRGVIETPEARVLLNDGQGTPASIKTPPFQFLISPEAPAIPPPVRTLEDAEPPEDFEPKIASDPNIFAGQYFLVFTTQDKGLGIDHYEVCEGKIKCVKAESPYFLLNQNLDQEIIVKAIDKNGNERIAVMPPPKPVPGYKNYVILAILIIAGLIITSVILRKILWRK